MNMCRCKKRNTWTTTPRVSPGQLARRTLILWLVIASAPPAGAKTFNLGILLPYSRRSSVGEKAAGAIPVALEDVNSDRSLTALRAGGHTMSFTWRDTQCDESVGLQMLVDLWSAKGNVDNYVDAFIGKRKVM